MGMHGPSSPRLTRYRLSLYRCGCKRLPEFLPRETIANIIEIPPNGYRGPGDANMRGCSDRCNSIEESTCGNNEEEQKVEFRFRADSNCTVTRLNKDQRENWIGNMNSHRPKSEAQITIRPQVLIDGENYAEYGSRKSCLSSNVGLAKKGTSLPMRFLGRFCLLLAFSLAFVLICSEIPESLSLYDDTSNDFLVSGPAPKNGRVQTARREANPRQDAAPTATLPSFPLIHCARPALPPGPNLLRLLSIQRK